MAETLPRGIYALAGAPAPAFDLIDTEGKPYRFNGKTGHWMFIHFWASWCGPCRREIPTIQQLYSVLDQDKLEMVVINTGENEDTIFNFLGLTAPDLTSLMDFDGQVTESYAPRGLPSTFLIDPDGRMQYVVLGGRPWDEKPYREFLFSISGTPVQIR
jgi:thiol-disulfide isomerase/thioredoxin